MPRDLRWIRDDEQSIWLEEILLFRQGLWPDYQRLSRETIEILYKNYPAYQLLALEGDEIAGIINSIPVTFDDSLNQLPDEGLNWVLSQLPKQEKPKAANYLAAISVTINPAFRKKGYATILLQNLKLIAAAQQLNALIIPARPSKKSAYPLIAMEDYIQWRRADNTAFDPWLRLHEKLGGKLALPCKKSRLIKGSVSQWEQWLGLSLPQTGGYLIKEGLNPLFINKEEDYGLYIEPNVWVIYPIS